MSRNICFAGGVAAIVVAVFPPLSTISQQLFSAHMLQHLLLIVVAAPLLVISGADARLQRFAFMRWLTQPAVAWIAFVAVFLFWHWASAFQWAAGSAAGELLEHVSIFVTAFLFWDVALSRTSHAQISYGARALYVMTAAVATDLPGVIMVFAPRAICTMPGENAYQWGITPLQDQQVAGLLMWVPANLAFFSVATWLFARWISDNPHSHSTLDSVIP
jgi:cytochrome c oxidase assembly factor CtaG